MSAYEITCADLEEALRALLKKRPALLEMLKARASVYSNGQGLHCHTCPDCRKVWQHPTPPDDISEACHDRWHQCPACGASQNTKTKLADVEHIDYPWEQPK